MKLRQKKTCPLIPQCVVIDTNSTTSPPFTSGSSFTYDLVYHTIYGMNSDVIYLDYAATTPVDPAVLDAMMPYFGDQFGNAASKNHIYGHNAEQAVRLGRSQIADLISCNPQEIVFTSGATEANNLAIKGIAQKQSGDKNHIITCQTEHKSVLDSIETLRNQGFDITLLPVTPNGLISPNTLANAICAQTCLISIMMVNNETGVIQPIATLGEIARNNGICFHCDATQAIGKIKIAVNTLGIDLLSFSAHKIYGPKGIGALWVNPKTKANKPIAQIDGGGHEVGIRSGTLNVPGIVAMGKASTLCLNHLATESKRIALLSAQLINRLTDALDDVSINGADAPRVPHILNISFNNTPSELVLLTLSNPKKKSVAIATGAACNTVIVQSSHVLEAMQCKEGVLNSALRFSIGRYTTEDDIKQASNIIIETINKIRKNN